mgnify:CR=1 FL=1
MALVLELGGGVGAGLVNGWPGRWSPLSPAVAFATHARSNAPRRPRASKRIRCEQGAGTLEPAVPGGSVRHSCDLHYTAEPAVPGGTVRHSCALQCTAETAGFKAHRK